jgi:hypothetical protein
VSLTAWLVIAAVCVVAGLVLLVLDRRRSARRPVPAPPTPQPPAGDPPQVPRQRGGPGAVDGPEEPGSLFRPNTPP